MPQLDPTSFASQLFWLTVSFVVLYVLLARLLLPRVQSVLEQRAGTIEADVAQAERLASEVARASEQYETQLLESRVQSQALFANVQAEAATQAAKRQGELDAVIEQKLTESDAAIGKAKHAIMDKLTPVAGELASLIVEVLVHQKPDAKHVGTVVNGLTKERSA